MRRIPKKEIRDKIWYYHERGYANREIADLLDITEFEVENVLRRE